MKRTIKIIRHTIEYVVVELEGGLANPDSAFPIVCDIVQMNPQAMQYDGDELFYCEETDEEPEFRATCNNDEWDVTWWDEEECLEAQNKGHMA